MARPLNFIPLLPLLLSFILLKSCGENKTFASSHCTETRCGDIEVKYPFWLQNTSSSTAAQLCGYKDFGLSCMPSSPYSTSPAAEAQLVLQILDEKWYVKNISYARKTVTLVDDDVTTNESCPRPCHNLTLDDDLPLSCSTLNLNLNFYLNCTAPLYPNTTRSPIIHPVDCLRSGGNVSYVSWERKDRQQEGTHSDDSDWFKVCEQKVVAPIIKKETDNLGLVKNLGRAMNEGFALDWHAEEDCVPCESSNGTCGFNNSPDQFLCFCNDGKVTYNHCNQGTLSFCLKYPR